MQGKGGGPKTAAGKARVSENAIKHAILNAHPVVLEHMESEQEWNEFRDGIVQSLAPEGALEKELSERVASILWRLRRVTRYETAAINVQVGSALGDSYRANWYIAKDKENVEEPDDVGVIIEQQQRVIPKGGALDNVTRYETHLHRLYLQTRHDLEALQASRRGERPHLARIDVIAPPRGTAASQPKTEIPDWLEKPLATLEKHSAPDRGDEGRAS